MHFIAAAKEIGRAGRPTDSYVVDALLGSTWHATAGSLAIRFRIARIVAAGGAVDADGSR